MKHKRKGKGNPPKNKPKRPYVVAKCVTCGHKRKVYAGEVPDGQMPECEQCYSVMVADGKAGVE